MEGGRPARLDVLLSVAEARKVAACAGAERAAWPAIVPRPNPTLRRQDGGAWIFWRPTTPRQESDLEVLSRTPAQPVLDLFFEEAEKGLAVPELLAAVAGRYGIEVDELAPFFEKLVDSGILIAEIEPPYNARRPLAFLAEAMRAAGCDAPWLPEIEAVEREVAALPGLAPEERIAAMDRLEERIAPRLDPATIVPDAPVTETIIVLLTRPLVVDLLVASGRTGDDARALLPEV